MSMKKWLALCLACLLAMALTGCGERESVGTVQVTVYGQDGAVMLEGEASIYKRSTVFDALIMVCGPAETEVYARGSGIYAVVTEIGGLRESDGNVWSFTVNGGETTVNAGRIQVKDGDKIVFYYGKTE